ncbi:hypothetical protein M3Y94_00615300 [Aphelenchoides besseyi]|nr:hypothetical protein M3Y94_00615300 [Aphelenchoides besseyi]
MKRVLLAVFLFVVEAQAANCPNWTKFGNGPPSTCQKPSDPNNKPKSGIELWFSRQMFDDLFPKANLGWGGNSCFPYSYESFIIAARYFPKFGTQKGNGNSGDVNTKLDLAAFFAHAIQETGENDISLYNGRSQQEADDCFYRGGFFNWFEGGPQSSFIPTATKGTQPSDGNVCISAGRYCSTGTDTNYFYPCGNGTSGQNYKSCYFGRGAIQISYNYNYGAFQDWLKTQNINVDLLTNPNLVMTKMDPPLAIMASLWFYMTPQPPKPAMHDIVIGNWNAGSQNTAAGFSGPIFGPTSLIINNECNGEDTAVPGGGGENRRIKAFKWFTRYFGVSAGSDKTLTCKNMPEKFDQMKYNLSYQPDWSSTWKSDSPCKCAPASYGGLIPYFQQGYYPTDFVNQNEANAARCQQIIYKAPQVFSLDKSTAPCLNVPING